jgi:hypothetical protein
MPGRGARLCTSRESNLVDNLARKRKIPKTLLTVRTKALTMTIPNTQPERLNASHSVIIVRRRAHAVSILKAGNAYLDTSYDDSE